MRRATFTCVGDLVVAIPAFIDADNERYEPFCWSKIADQILTEPTAERPDTRHKPTPPEAPNSDRVPDGERVQRSRYCIDRLDHWPPHPELRSP